MNIEQIVAQAESAAPSWTSAAERSEMCKLASEVQKDGLIVEIGGLYGGMTAVLGLSNPQAHITVIDEFSWDPYKKGASAETLLENVKRVGVANVEVITGDSRIIGRNWTKAIDLLWIDGGHSYEFVKSDLDRFGPHAKRIALHDWDNPFWKSIRQAVEDFLKVQPGWKFDHSVEMVAVLERLPMAEPQMSEM